MSRAGMIVAGIYFVIALAFVLSNELSPPPTSVRHSMQHLGTYLATLPASAPLGALGLEPNFDNKLTIAAVLAASTAIVYGVVSLVVSLVAWLFTSR